MYEGMFNLGHGITIDGKIIIFTMIDYAKKEGTFKFFDSKEELENWSKQFLRKEIET